MEPDPEIEGRVILITGAAEGIGLGMAVRLARAGARLVLGSRDASRGEAAAEAIATQAGCDPGRVYFIPTDVTVEAEVERLVRAGVARYGRLDGAINNAVYSGDFQLLAEEPAEAFEQTLRTNVSGVFHGIKHQVRQFLEQGARPGDGYSIINVSSGATRDIAPRMGAYVASKMAVEGLTRAAAVEYSPLGIRVNTLLFGVFETEKSARLHAAMPDIHAKNLGKHLVGRLGDPVHDAGETAIFLLSRRSSFMTGSELIVDGGMCARAGR
ncbi:MAG: SDR family oxidoreductase [Chromatiales bacterium]|nr:SDR family oxidoreductase [Chromatiales bacterium]